MAYQCINASNQYFTIAAPSISVPPVTFSLWINTASIIAKDTALFNWRGSINTAVILKYVSPNWELRYYIDGGNQWQTATGLNVSTGVWQHACVAITSSQARLYIGAAAFTNNVSHSTANLNASGDLARDSFAGPSHTSFDGSVAEAAIWSAALSDAECLALGNRLSPLLLKNRLPELVLYKDLTRSLNRGIGPALTAVNSPGVVAHPPLIHSANRLQSMFPQRRFQPPFQLSKAAVHASPVSQGGVELAGTAQGTVAPLGEVSS